MNKLKVQKETTKGDFDPINQTKFIFMRKKRKKKKKLRTNAHRDALNLTTS